MEISTLSNVPLAVLADTFNQAFSDYLVPMQVTEDDLKMKFVSENTKPEHSLGVFDNGKLVAFMFIGTESSDDKTVFYNGGTGVIPSYRGQQLTKKMYAHLLEQQNSKNKATQLLEVITDNLRAVKVYETVGFTTQRVVTCFKGIVTAPEHPVSFSLQPITFEETVSYEKHWEFKPSYQNTTTAIKRTANLHHFLGAFDGNTLVGYITFVKSNGRVKQFWVNPDFQCNGIGHQLFYKTQEIVEGKPISLTNIDSSQTKTITFLTKIGLAQTVQQFEMEL